ncbi:hypothetical protein HPB48_011958 [Haemaphysalis longicornis]|uniref:Uncharacterized protein n=1 Tax=Haemaphysalis longicornis TaxID=44386 RepID=A0A9J6FLH8_HAELO|nr:hypothetical protein HPB48_011958 [Haemaphysalis longicornis]
MVPVHIARELVGVAFDLRGRRFQLALVFGALAMSALITAHRADPLDCQEMKKIREVAEKLQQCRNRTADRSWNSSRSNLESVHSRTLCPSRPSFDYDRLRVPANLTTVECACDDRRCPTPGLYYCKPLYHKFPVMYNGTPKSVMVPVACACVAETVVPSKPGPERPS